MDCADPEVFATAAVAVLSRYPEHVARAITDPVTGLPGTSKWVPTIAELRDACDAINNAAKRREEADARVAAQFAERERMASMTDSERRKAFISNWRKEMNIAFSKTGDVPVEKMDIRGAEPDQVRFMRPALEKHIDELTRRFRSVPCSPLGSFAARSVPSEPDEEAVA